MQTECTKYFFGVFQTPFHLTGLYDRYSSMLTVLRRLFAVKEAWFGVTNHVHFAGSRKSQLWTRSTSDTRDFLHNRLRLFLFDVTKSEQSPF